MTDRHRIYLTVATVVASLVAVILSAIFAPVARAEWPHDAFTCRAYRADLYWHTWAREHCPDYGWRWRQWRRWQWNQQPSEGPLCHDTVRATGTQGESEESAYDRAIIAWQGQVQFLHGARYVILKAARDATVNCAPSNIPDAVRDKISGIIGAGTLLYRCEIKARPCRQPPQKIDLKSR